jgi:hypothetical protein
LLVSSAECIRRDAKVIIALSPDPIKDYCITYEIARIDELMQSLSTISVRDLWPREQCRKKGSRNQSPLWQTDHRFWSRMIFWAFGWRSQVLGPGKKADL